MEKSIKKAGGKREGAGKPLKYGEETVMYYCRIPASQKDAVDKIVKKHIKKFEVVGKILSKNQNLPNPFSLSETASRSLHL